MKKSAAHPALSVAVFALHADGREKRIKADALRLELADGCILHLQLSTPDEVLISAPAEGLGDGLLIRSLDSHTVSLSVERDSAAPAPSTLDLTVQYVVKPKGAPGKKSLRRWAHAALRPGLHALVTVRVVAEDEMQALNRNFCGKDYPTNVLSFPYEEASSATELAGDVVLCAPVIAREAETQGKSLEAHWAHLVVHGVLHLQGHDHQNDAEAEAMESLETVILHGLGFADPYASEKDAEADLPF